MNYYPPRLIAGIDNRPLPVSLLDFKEHLRIDHDDQDRLLVGKLQAATVEVENYIGRPIIVGQYRLTLPRFPSVARDDTTAILIPNSPLVSVESVKYLDENDTLQTVDAAGYRIMTVGTYHRVVPETDMTWPTTQTVDDAVMVEYTAGLAATSNAVPAAIQEAILLRAGTRYVLTEETGVGNRQPWSLQKDIAVLSLLAPYSLLVSVA